MAPKHHHMPLSGGDRKALKKELSKSRAMTSIFAERSAEKRREGEALIREADNLACQSWNEKMWSDGGPIDPSPTVDQAINGGFPWLEIKCSRCNTPRDVDLAALRHVPTTCVHDLVGGDIGARVAYHTRFYRHEQEQSTATSGRAHDLDPRVSPGVRRVDESLL
jgi:hypothetical protein